MIEAIRRETEAAADRIDVTDVLGRFTTDVIAETAFGIKSNSLCDTNTKFYEIAHKHVTTISFIKRTFLMRFPDWGRRLQYVAAFY